MSNWENRKSIVLSEKNPWWEKAVSFLEILVEEASGRYPIAPIHMRGPFDILAAVQGFNRSLDVIIIPVGAIKQVSLHFSFFWGGADSIVDYEIAKKILDTILFSI